MFTTEVIEEEGGLKLIMTVKADKNGMVDLGGNTVVPFDVLVESFKKCKEMPFTFTEILHGGFEGTQPVSTEPKDATLHLEKPDLNKPGMDIFPQTRQRVENDQCATCGKEILESDFKDDLSKKEYTVSGMCQTCQDDIWK